jgi:hypothetical protein
LRDQYIDLSPISPGLGPAFDLQCHLRKPDNTSSLIAGSKAILPPNNPPNSRWPHYPVDAPDSHWSCFIKPPNKTISRIYCVMSEENGPEGKCSDRMAHPANNGLGTDVECEVGDATFARDGYTRIVPGGLSYCLYGVNDNEEKTRIFQIYGDTASLPKWPGPLPPIPECKSEKPAGKPLIESEKITLQPKGQIGSMNQSCFKLKPGQTLKSAYCVMSDKDGQGKCVYGQDCDIGNAEWARVPIPTSKTVIPTNALKL